MKPRIVAAFLAGVILASGTGLAWAHTTGPERRTVQLRDGDRIVMSTLQWECLYDVRGISPWTNAPRGPVLSCGRLGAWTGGVRTHTNLYYIRH